MQDCGSIPRTKLKNKTNRQNYPNCHDVSVDTDSTVIKEKEQSQHFLRMLSNGTLFYCSRRVVCVVPLSRKQPSISRSD